MMPCTMHDACPMVHKFFEGKARGDSRIGRGRIGRAVGGYAQFHHCEVGATAPHPMQNGLEPGTILDYYDMGAELRTYGDTVAQIRDQDS